MKVDKTLLLKNLEDYFSGDRKRINHAKTVLKYAELILEHEGGDADVVTCAAVLHDVGIKEAERKYNSVSGKYQELEGPPIARRIMKSLGIDSRIIDEACDIIAHHHTPNVIDTLNFKVIWDADFITNVIEGDIRADKQKMNLVLKTAEGKKIANSFLP